MYEHDGLYNYFPAQTIGGPTGDYSLTCPVTSAKWVEYRVISVTSITGATSVMLSGGGPPKDLKQDASQTLNDTQFANGEYYYFGSGTAQVGGTIIPNDGWQRVTHSQKKAFARIDTSSGYSAYVTLQFRARILDKVPGQVTTAHPDHAQQMNIARSDAVKERLKIVEEETEGGALSTVTQDKRAGGLYYGR